jgi:Tol biopolymer transport system component
MIAFLRNPEAGYVYTDLYTIKPDGTDMRLVRSFNNMSVQIPGDGSVGMDWSPDGSFFVYGGAPWGVMSVLNVETGAYGDIQTMPGLAYLENPSLGPDLEPNTPGFQGFIVCETALGEPMGEWGPGGLVVFYAQITTVADTPHVVVGEMEFLPVPHEDPEEWLTVRFPIFSPDGQTIAFLQRDFYSGGPLLYTLDVTADPELGVTFGEPVQIYDWRDYRPNGHILGKPTWSPDGAFIGFTAISAWKNGGGYYLDMFRIRPDGTDLTAVTNVSDRQSAFGANWNPAWVNDLDP